LFVIVFQSIQTNKIEFEFEISWLLKKKKKNIWSVNLKKKWKWFY